MTVISDLNSDGRLVVTVGSEGLLLFARNARVPLDDLGHDAARGLDTQRQRCDVDEQHVLDGGAGVAAEDGGLHSGSVRYRLVGVDGQVQRFAAEEIL